MKLRILSISNKATPWSSQGIDHFMTKFPKGMRPELVELTPNKNIGNIQKKLLNEKDRLKSRIDPSSWLVILDEAGATCTSAELSRKLDLWILEGGRVDMIIGGAEGLHESLKAEADEMISLSKLTLPHQIARLVLIEALYRAATMLINHPYHRA
jgi:23S rRNA (pseudouridine1915-N3)-methyltransferase